MSNTYLLIGASSDVGSTYIRHLAKKNDGDLCILAHCFGRPEKFDAIKAEFPELDIKVFKADLSDLSETERLIKDIRDTGRVPEKFMFLPAPAFSYMRIKELDTDRVEQSFRIQAESFLKPASGFFPDMKKIEGARAVVMLTKYVADEMPPKFMTDYIVAKYALLGAMKAAAAEYGGGKLMINGISPDMMDTSFLKNMDPKIKEMAVYQKGRLMMPEDLVAVFDEMLSAGYLLNGVNRSVTLG